MMILFAIKAINQTKGGAERVLADISAELADRGHQVSLLTLDVPSENTFYKLSGKIKRIALGTDDALRPARFIETLKRIPAIRIAIKKEKPDIVVAFMHSMFVPAAFASAGLGIPFLASEHIVRAHYKERKFEFLLLLISSVFIDAYTVLSDAVRQTYPACIRRKMHIVPNPVTQAFLFADPVGAADKAKKILTVGRLEPQKRQDILISAFAMLAPQYPDWVLEIVGEGSLKSALDEQVERLGLTDRVTLLPPTREIANVYAGAQIFAIPSAYESFGLATAEAMSHGLPAVGFADCPGTNELINHGRNGLLAEGGKSDEDRIVTLAGTLEILMKDPVRRTAMGDEARTLGVSFAPEKIADRWEALLAQLIRKDA